MDDLSERDLSGIPDGDLSAEERGEIRRRLDRFLGRMQLRRLAAPGGRGKAGANAAADAPERPKKKRLANWKPRVLRRSG